MDFEELALKSIDPSLGPPITRRRLKELEKKIEDREKERVQVSRTFFSMIWPEYNPFDQSFRYSTLLQYCRPQRFYQSCWHTPSIEYQSTDEVSISG